MVECLGHSLCHADGRSDCYTDSVLCDAGFGGIISEASGLKSPGKDCTMVFASNIGDCHIRETFCLVHFKIGGFYAVHYRAT